MDAKSEAEVWNRVNAAASGGDFGKARERGPIGPELLEAMTRAKETGRELRSLSQKAGGETARTLRQLSTGMGNQEKTLEGLYYFLTGTVPKLAAPQQTARQERMTEALRRLMQGRELNVGRFEALAARATGEASRTLRELAEEETKNFRTLLRVLKSFL